MLKKLKFSNFKTWKSCEVEFGRITGLFGTNSSGKSSITQFLLMLKQTKDATDRNLSLELNGQYVELGIFRDIAHNHDESIQINWNLKFDRNEKLHLRAAGARTLELIAEADEVEISSAFYERARQKDIISNYLRYEVGGQSFSLTPKESGDGYQLLSDGGTFQFTRNTGRVWQLPGPIKSYAFPDQARTYFQNSSFLADLETAFEGQFENIYYLGPLREYPARDYLWSRNRPADVGKKGEKSVDAILAMTAAEEKRNIKHKAKLRPFQEIVAYWLKHIGVIDHFRVKEIAEGSNRWQAMVTTRPGGTEALLTDVGFGVSQVLPVITLLQYVEEGSTVILEQPEIHLHPLAQANLADAIINAAMHRKVQVIIESHSEHLLLRLQRRIAEEVISNEDVKLYFASSDRSSSNLDELKVDMFGNILNWPPNFMGDAFGETVEAEKARLRRMGA